MSLAIYSEPVFRDGRYGDRFWLAPPGLGIAQARAQRVGRFRKTREGARQALVAHIDQQRRTQRQ